ncbi:unnamed protein product [Ectocarpus sp. 12 AP-2014]
MDVVVGGVGRAIFVHSVICRLSLDVGSAVWSHRALPFNLRAVRLTMFSAHTENFFFCVKQSSVDISRGVAVRAQHPQLVRRDRVCQTLVLLRKNNRQRQADNCCEKAEPVSLSTSLARGSTAVLFIQDLLYRRTT